MTERGTQTREWLLPRQEHHDTDAESTDLLHERAEVLQIALQRHNLRLQNNTTEQDSPRVTTPCQESVRSDQAARIPISDRAGQCAHRAGRGEKQSCSAVRMSNLCTHLGVDDVLLGDAHPVRRVGDEPASNIAHSTQRE